MKTMVYTKSVFSILLAAIAAGCGKNNTGDESAHVASGDPVGEIAEYEWVSEGTPAGRHRVVRTGDGRISTDLFVHWNNREYTVKDELQLDANGLTRSQRITGTSPFGAPIDESFSIVDGVASWKSVGESGSTSAAAGGIYLPNEMGSVESIGALVRAALKNIDGQQELIPSGTATVRKVKELTVGGDPGDAVVSLYSIAGIGFTPSYVWMDQDLQVFALDFGGFMGMARKGFGEDVLELLSAEQSKSEATYFEEISPGLSNRLAQPLIIRNVDVVDVENGSLRKSQNVVIANGHIRELSNAPVAADNAMVIDGTGKTLMPGLWDMHGHFGISEGILNIAGGITSVRDVGNVHDRMMEMTEKFASGAVIGPHTYRSGFIDKASPYATGDTVETLQQALDRVDWYADRGYIQIKLYSSIDPTWVEPIAKRTHARNMRLSGHIPAFMSAEQAVRAGYDEIQHINMVFLNFLAGDREDTRQQIRFTLYGDKAGELDLDGAEAEAFFKLLKERDVVIDPTAAIFDTQLVHKAGEPDPTFAAIVEHLPLSVSRSLYNPEFEINESNEAAWKKSQLNAMKMLRKLYDKGIRIVPGSDSLPGFTIHRELEVYAEAGIPHAAVLRIATLDSAAVVGAANRSGSIRVGKEADLVLLDGNPLEDISAIRRAVAVIKGGYLYRPDELYAAVGVTPFVQSLPARSN
ncbi:MAG: amidohydrolase family protein [Gammaproteobacteria bacterium]|nr:amidohydrolase family protein [Gammaproteobacteria bacterium]